MKTFSDERSLEQTGRNRVVDMKKTPINYPLMLMSCNTHGEASPLRNQNANATFIGQGLFVSKFSVCRRLTLPLNTLSIQKVDYSSKVALRNIINQPGSAAPVLQQTKQ